MLLLVLEKVLVLVVVLLLLCLMPHRKFAPLPPCPCQQSSNEEEEEEEADEWKEEEEETHIKRGKFIEYIQILILGIIQFFRIQYTKLPLRFRALRWRHTYFSCSQLSSDQFFQLSCSPTNPCHSERETNQITRHRGWEGVKAVICKSARAKPSVQNETGVTHPIIKKSDIAFQEVNFKL